jgi:hypothetical protein
MLEVSTGVAVFLEHRLSYYIESLQALTSSRPHLQAI